MLSKFIALSQWKKFAIVFAVLTVVFVGGSVQRAYAAPGYFTGGNFSTNNGHDLAHNFIGVNDTGTFINHMWACLNNSAPCNSLNGQVAASYMILTMLGDGNHSTGQAFARWGDWVNIVNQYSAAGRINFNFSYPYTLNTMMVPYNGSPYDVVQYSEGATANPSIVFTNPDGSTYAIKKDCANPVGNMSPLQNAVSSFGGYVVDADTGGAVPNLAAEGIMVHLYGAGGGATQNNPYNYGNLSPGWRDIRITIAGGSQYEVAGMNMCNVSCWGLHAPGGPGWVGAPAGSTDFTRAWNFQAGQHGDGWFLVRKKRALAQGYVITEGGGPVSGSTVHVQNVGTSSSNPFFIGNIPTGGRLFFITPPAGFEVVGSNMCRSSGSQAGIPQCAAGYPGFSNQGGQGWATGASRTVDFAPGVTYDVRWIIRPLITCSMVFAPNLIDPVSSFSVTGTATGPAAVAAYPLGGNQMTITVSGPATQTRVVNPTTLSGTTITGVANFTPLGAAGTYTITMRLGGVFAGSDCLTQTRVIAYMPTFTARNGDIVAGMTLPNADTGVCSAVDTSAGIAGWNQAQSTTPDFIGSGGNLGAMALHAIQGYATGTAGAGGGTGGGISFANSPAGSYSYTNDTGRFGGNFGGYVTSCAPDYYAQRLTESPLQPIPPSSMNSWNGAYVGTGNVTISGANNLPQSRHIRVYVDGNVRITGNITFTNGLSVDLADRDRIPSVWIIATGNIYVDPSVTELNGIYVAQGKSTSADTGGFYSCIPASSAFTSFVPGTSSYDYNACSANTLTVNGSVIAKRLVLTRSRGSVGSTVAQTYAEVFNYSPLVWLSPTGIGGSSAGTDDLGNDYQSITSLPPVL